MDQIPQRLQEAATYLRSLSARTRVVGAALALAVVVGVFSFGMRQQSSELELLFGGRDLSDRELDRMEAAFSTAGLMNWQRDSDRIRVPQREKFSYMAALAENNVLPENSDEVFYETMQSSKFYESSQQRALRIKYATQREAGMIVQAMTGIDSATVRYVDVAGRGFGAAKTTRANVAVRTTDNHALTAEQITAICDTVAYTIGADAKDVVVTDLVAVQAYRGDEVVRSDQQSRLRSQKQREWEDSYREQITSTLAMIDGVIVNVRVYLHDDLAAASVDRRPTTTPADGKGAGQPTLLEITPHAPANDEQAYGNQPLSIHRVKHPTAEAIATPAQHASMWEVDKVSALVSIPKSYFHKIWQQRCRLRVATTTEGKFPPPSDTELTAIETDTRANVRQLVLSCLPGEGDRQADEEPVVVTSHFDVREVPPVEIRPIAVERYIFRYWREIAGVAAVGVVILMLTWTIRSATQRSTKPDPQVATVTNIIRDDDNDDRATAEALRGELASRVRQDPSKTADTLKHWLRDAA